MRWPFTSVSGALVPLALRLPHPCLFQHHQNDVEPSSGSCRCKDGRCSQWLQGADEGNTLQADSINQSINIYRAIVQRRVLQCGYAESKRNTLRKILNVLTDGEVRQFSGREFQSLGAAIEKRRAAVSELCGGTDRNFQCTTF